MKWKVLVTLLALTSPLRAQSTAAEDSLLRKQVRTYLDSIAKDKTAPQYSKRAQAKIDTLTMKHVKVVPPPLPAAPIASFVVTCSTAGDFLCQFDGTKSSGYRLGFAWDCGAIPNCTPGNVPAFTFKYPSAGDRTARVTVRDSLGRQSDTTRIFSVVGLPKPDSQPPVVSDSLPEKPRRLADFRPKSCARSVDVNAGADLQSAVNASQPGDCLELAPGASWKVNLRLPPRTCSDSTKWTTIRTKGVVDAPGTRMDTVQAKGFASIVQANNQYAIGTSDPTSCWQIMHLNIARDTANAATLVYHLIVLGFSVGDGNTSLATQPSKIILRRNWIHGTVDGQLIRCVAVNGADLAVVDNWIDECHASGFDSQAIEGWNGSGPVYVENNFAAGAGENIMFGGADPADSTMRPADIVIRRNHVYKNPAWKGKWSIKNLFELKNVTRILIDGNVFENSWASSQIGFAIIFKSSTGSMTSTLQSGSTNITFTNNRVNNANLGLNIQAKDCTGQACIVFPVDRVLAQNNLFTGIGSSNGADGSGWLNPVYNGPRNTHIINNTFVGNRAGAGKAMFLSGGAQADWGLVEWRNNIFASQDDYVIGADCAQPTHMAALDCLIGPGKWTFTGNVVSGIAQTYWSKNPPSNTYKVTQAEIGLQPDYSAPSFPGVGADIPALQAKINGVAAVMSAVRRSGKAAPRKIARPKYTDADRAWCQRNACTLPPR